MYELDEIELIKQKIDKVDIVSFDVFDTLLLRNVMQPTDLFDAVEVEYFNHTGKNIEFKRKRILAEKKARKASSKEDITYDEIYAQLEGLIKGDIVLLKELELQLEDEFLICNTKMLEIYQFAVEQNKQIFIISDMYLPKKEINTLLMKKGYKGKHTTYVSSEVIKSKATGSMYAYIRNQEKVSEDKKWLHIGDNYIADIENAEKQGVEGYYYKAVRERYEQYEYKTLADSIIRALQINTMYLEDTHKDYWYNFGIDKAAPLYIGFMCWLEKELEGKNNIYFLARDGYMAFQLYKIMSKYNKKLPKGKYLYGSRRAYIYPTLLDMTKEQALEILTISDRDLEQYNTTREIFDNIGLQIDKYDNQLVDKGILNKDELLKEEKHIKAIKDFLLEIWGDIEEVLKQEKEMTLAYLKQENIDVFQELNIVDIGWRGSTHRALQELLGRPVNGYYLGTIRQIYEEIRPYSKAYLFSEGKPRRTKKFIMENVMIFELLFSAPMGSVKNFIEDNGNIVPIMNQYIDSLEECTQCIQKGILKIFDQAYRSYIFREVKSDLRKEGCSYPMQAFIKNKQITDLGQFAKIGNIIGIGDCKTVKSYVYEISSEEYISRSKQVGQIGMKLLWKDAILIKDCYGRQFNTKEFSKFHNMRYRKQSRLIKKIKKITVKFMKNPGKIVELTYTKIIKGLRGLNDEYTNFKR